MRVNLSSDTGFKIKANLQMKPSYTDILRLKIVHYAKMCHFSICLT